MRNTYSDAPLADALHGAARLHVHLGRMDGENISTRGWTYNDLVSGVIGLSTDGDMHRCLACLFDTLDAMTEIGANAVAYLHALARRP